MPEGESAALTALLADLDHRQVRMHADGDRLRCSAPSGVLTEDLLAKIRTHKAEILQQLADRELIPPADRGKPLALSFAQEQLWLAHHLEPDSSAYHIPLAVELRGGLQPSTLRQALAEVVRRHETLRTSFPVRHGRPYQRIAPFRPPSLPIVDLAGLPVGQREPVLRSLTAAAARRPFDLTNGPVMRTALVRLGPADHRLLMTRHHIASDGWSFGVLAAELTAHYRAFSAGRRSPLAPLRRQYGDFAAWQRGSASGEGWRDRQESWRRRLAGSPPGLAIVDDRPTGEAPVGPAATLRRDLPPAAVAVVRRMARETGVPSFSVLLAGFGLALVSAAGQPEVVVGSPSNGRVRSELEPMIGTFATVLPLRLDLTNAGSFRQAVRRSYERVTEALANQDIPLEHMVEVLRPQHRRYGRNPLFAIAFAFQNTPAGQLDLPAVAARVEEPVPVDPKFPLTLTVTALDGNDEDPRYRLLAEYDNAVLPGEAVAEVMERFLRILDEGCGSPELSAAALIRRAASTRVAEPRAAVATTVGPGGLGAAFAATAARTPDAIAVSHHDCQLSYAELHRRARRLAGQLRMAGVGLDTPVGLCVRHRAELVVAVVGIALAGGAYVPVDPADPPARHEAVFTDAGLRVLVTESGLADGFSWFEGRSVLVDSGSGTADTGSVRPPAPHISPDNLAYVIYTSGSTGVPKGVMVSHRNVAALLAAASVAHRATGDDVWTLTHSSAFDFSVWEMWAPLLAGSKLVVVPRQTARDPYRLWRLLGAEQVTVFSATPSAFHALMPAAVGTGARRSPLRTVVLGGERCEPSRLRDWFDAGGDEQPALINMYGITETTVHVTWRRLGRADLAAWVSPIGRPLPGMRVQVVNQQGVPPTVGGEGEMLIGGTGVTRGYLGQPALTAARFLPDPLGEQPGARLYASGDLARLATGGELGYLGRYDEQVKIRGYRIEPAEVEAVLAAHPDVTAAAVGVSQDGERLVLVGYVVPGNHGEPAPSARELRRYCAEWLPAHLVPANFTTLDQLPVTRNGKLDRAALRSLPTAVASVADQASPRSPTEQALAALWCELLGLASIGVNDDFFEVGGDSLVITRLHARVPEVFGVELPMRQLYEALDIASQAAAIEQRRTEQIGGPVAANGPVIRAGVGADREGG